MNRISLFIKLYRKRKFDNITIFILFSLLASVISMVLLVQANNKVLFRNQLISMGILSERNLFDAKTELEIALFNTENVLGIIAMSAIIICVIGGLSLIGFRNSNAIKALVMMHICGMQKKDLILKECIDIVFFGIPSIVIGHMVGYFLFTHFTKTILASEKCIQLFSFVSILALCKSSLLVVFIILCGNLFFDLKVLDSAPATFLYNRSGEKNKHLYIVVLILELFGTMIYSLCIFHIEKKYIMISVMIIVLLSGALFLLFHLFFGVFTRKKRHNIKINRLKDISFCFLCSRNKRDAILAIVISVGTIILCMGANILFNVDEILRSAYRDNLGYTSIVFADNIFETEKIKTVLDNNNYVYTLGYSKLMNYSELKGMELEDGQFWALIIDTQTDHNFHFMIPNGTFLGENYFESRCNLLPGEDSALFGGNVIYTGNITDNQYMSLISYNFLINKSDYHLGIDDDFHPVFMMDISEKDELSLKHLLKGYACHIDSAAELINELKMGLQKYLDILVVLVFMIVVVTATIFYTVIRQDLYKRKTEMYLYRIFGASSNKAQKIIFLEYLMISIVSAFAVSFTIMFWGEIYFYFGVGKHFPFSIPIIIFTSCVAGGFVFICCRIAGIMNEKTVGLEAIRDE